MELTDRFRQALLLMFELHMMIKFHSHPDAGMHPWQLMQPAYCHQKRGDSCKYV